MARDSRSRNGLSSSTIRSERSACSVNSAGVAVNGAGPSWRHDPEKWVRFSEKIMPNKNAHKHMAWQDGAAKAAQSRPGAAKYRLEIL
jgi:hypothetical protein